MKKTLLTTILASILAFALIFSASAAPAVMFEFPAKELNSLGLFQGTGNSFDLDKAPKRDAAITMLIRLLGLENEALSGSHSHPFTDVPADNWAYPYVALAYEKGLTTGTTTTTFNPSGACTAQMYVTYVLRALGYSDAEGGDFKYGDAIEFGKSKGIADDSILSGDFLRGGMVAVSYLGILAKPNGSDFSTLLEKLVSEGAVSADAAAPVLERLKLLGEIKSINIGVSDGAASVSATTESLLSLTVRTDSTVIGEKSELKIKTGENDSVTAAIKTTATIDGDETKIEIYIADDSIYINDGKDKTKIPLDSAMNTVKDGIPDGVAAEAQADAADTASMQIIPLFIISGIAKTVEDNLSVYNVTFVKALMDEVVGQLISVAMEQLGSSEAMGGYASMLPLLKAATASADKASINIYVDENNAVKKIDVEFNVSIVLLGAPVATVKFTTALDVVSIGDDVTIELPDDLDTYVAAADADTAADAAQTETAA